MPNFLQARLFQRWFLPIPLDVLVISLVCVALNHCDFFREVAGDELMVMDSERSARTLSEERQEDQRKEKLAAPQRADSTTGTLRWA